MEEIKKVSNTGGFFDTFLSKLKEQSFIIILMLGGLYYQNKMFEDQLNSYKSIVDQKQTIIDQKQSYADKIVEDERARLLEREKYLVEQRDKYVEHIIEMTNSK